MTPEERAAAVMNEARSGKLGAQTPQRTEALIASAIRAAAEQEREASEHAGMFEALRYIDSWITHALCTPLVPAASAILDDMRVHIRAAHERLQSGGQLEATTPLA